MAINVSPTMLNDYASYKRKETCGEWLRLVRIEKLVEQKTSKPMLYGQRFEYEALGNLDGRGNIPEAFYKQNGSGVLAIQITITQQANNFKNWLAENNIRVIESGLKIENQFDGLDMNIKGIIDAVVERNGEEIIIDTKMSGNLYNAESDWGWHPETILLHEHKIRQVILYLYLYNTVFDKNVDTFIFFVASSKYKDQFKPFEIKVSKETYESKLNGIIELAKEMLFEIEIGLDPLPDPARCLKCEAQEICKFKMTTASSEIINF